MHEPTTTEPIVLRKTTIPREALDPDAVRVVARLKSRGFESYLVGGCVRDLLLGLRPKDFDMATEARPRKVKMLFSNCRIIGRRFKLAHLHFPGKILEVSTFRRTPEGLEPTDDLLIRSDNLFGTAAQDAYRRDFTINGLFYDPEEDSVLDHVGGLEDLERRRIRTIGDPRIRFREDPVRILRAARFASKLGFTAEEETVQAMREAARDLVKSAPPRVLEEVLRLLRGGSALPALQMLRDWDALEVVLPEVGAHLKASSQEERAVFWRHLEALDDLAVSGHVPTTPTLLASLFLPLLEARAGDADGPALARIVEDTVAPFALRMRLSRRDGGRLKRILMVQRRFHAPPRARKKFRPQTFVRQDYFPEGILGLRMRCFATGRHWGLYETWWQLWEEAAGAGAGRAHPAAAAPSQQFTTRGAPPRAGGESTAGTVREARLGPRRPEPASRGPRDEQGGKDEDRPRRRRRRRRGEGRREEGRQEGAEGRKEQGRRNQQDRKDQDRKDQAPREKGRRGQGRKGQAGERKQSEEAAPEAPETAPVELDPRQVPSYGALLGETPRRRTKPSPRKPKPGPEEEGYIPPPPPTFEPEKPKGEEEEETFGDW